LELDLWIRSYEDELVFDLFETEETRMGMEKIVLPNFAVRLNVVYFSTVYHIRSIIHLTISVEQETDFVASWLFTKLNGKTARLEIDQSRVEIDEADIARLLRNKAKKT